MPETPEDLAAILLAALEDPANRLSNIRSFQDVVWDSCEPLGDDNVDRILSDLADALDFYEPNPEWRSEDVSYYGDDRFEEYVRSALRKLTDEGVNPRPRVIENEPTRDSRP